MIACLDVDYRADHAIVACLLFTEWTDETENQQLTKRINDVAPYVSGEFYKRELPCLLAALTDVQHLLTAVVIDGYVWLAPDKKGLGAYLYEALSHRLPVIGVAKTNFHAAPSVPVLRGDSQNPLFVTAAGIDTQAAADCVARMHGPFRLPTLLKKVDRLCRDALLP